MSGIKVVSILGYKETKRKQKQIELLIPQLSPTEHTISLSFSLDFLPTINWLDQFQINKLLKI